MREKIEEKKKSQPGEVGTIVAQGSNVRPASGRGLQGAFDAVVHARPQVTNLLST
jgi:hypothetical protein